MVIGASPGAGCCVSADGDEGEVDSVAVSMFFLLRCYPPPVSSATETRLAAGTHGRLFGRVVLVGVERAGGFYHKFVLSSFQPRECRVTGPSRVVTVQGLQPCLLIHSRDRVGGAGLCRAEPPREVSEPPWGSGVIEGAPHVPNSKD